MIESNKNVKKGCAYNINEDKKLVLSMSHPNDPRHPVLRACSTTSGFNGRAAFHSQHVGMADGLQANMDLVETLPTHGWGRTFPLIDYRCWSYGRQVTRPCVTSSTHVLQVDASVRSTS